MLTLSTFGSEWRDAAAKPWASVRAWLWTLWRTDRPLTFVGLLMLAVLAGSAVGIAIDPRTISGAPVWLKPAKFALSTSIFSLTLSWVFTFLPEWPRLRRVVSWTTSAVFVMEVGIIDLQAWRGTTSHFNLSTPFNGALFGLMGLGIVLQTLAMVLVAVALWRQQFGDRAMGAALRAGLIINLLGAATGGVMTTPTGTQLQQARDTGRMPIGGAHTVGAPDGGPGLPGVGWSLEHGDLRIPHFVGLHALQALPLLAIWLRRRNSGETALRIVRRAAVGYGALFAILLTQALRGEPLAQPSVSTLALLVVWVVGSAGAVWAATREPGSLRSPSVEA